METKRLDNAALAAGISPDYINAHGKPQSIAAATKQRLLDAMHRTTTATKVAVDPLPPVQVFTHGKKMSLPVAGRGEFQWILTTEEGKQYQGKVRGGESLPLPAKLPEGYHSLTLTQDGERWHCRAIVTPVRCYEPQALKEGQNCGAPAYSFIRCARRKTGESAILAIYARCCRRFPARRRVYRS
jgi:4-alpha-glucanotransferase